MPVKYDVFLSYSSADRAWAQSLKDKLEVSGMRVFLDKTRLSVGQPYQPQLFRAIEDSQALVLVWSDRVRDMQGNWKEWVITEREHFRLRHPEGPIIYILLDDALPQVDAQDHMLDQLRQKVSPSSVDQPVWNAVTAAIKTVVFSGLVEIQCFILACTRTEFDQLAGEVNLQQVLADMGLEFGQVRDWYDDNRDQWRPAGGRSVAEVLGELEGTLTAVLQEAGVPERYCGRQIVVRTDIPEIWTPIDAQAKQELDRLSRLELGWCLIDPLSMYHPAVNLVAHRFGSVLKKNSWFSVFVLDPTGYLRDRSALREKLQMDFSDLYQHLVRPGFDDTLSCLGAIDAWHTDDFEWVFREAIRRRRNVVYGQTRPRSRKSGFTSFGQGS